MISATFNSRTGRVFDQLLVQVQPTPFSPRGEHHFAETLEHLLVGLSRKLRSPVIKIIRLSFLTALCLMTAHPLPAPIQRCGRSGVRFDLCSCARKHRDPSEERSDTAINRGAIFTTWRIPSASTIKGEQKARQRK
jgi:hypothetical protein